MRIIIHSKFTIFILIFLAGILLSACGRTAISDAEAEAAWQSSAHSLWYHQETPESPTDCAKCHNSFGYLKFLGIESSTILQAEAAATTGARIECQVCHNEVAMARDFAIMPSGLKLSDLGQEANCMECHQGLSSSPQVAETIADLPKDQVNRDLMMPDVHANAVGATFFGTQAMGAAEYPNFQYSSKFHHLNDTCVTCHDPHSLQVRVDRCSACHLEATSIQGLRDIRLIRTDYDGDGNISEGLAGEVDTMLERLLITIRLYAAITEGTDRIVYIEGFFNQNGEIYSTWTPELLQAAYNYHYVAKDPGSYSHNPKYILQLLYDSIDELGGSTRGMTRPATDK